MGLRDRIKQKLRSPMTVAMQGLGTETRARAGAPARVVVEVAGTDDGTVDRIDVYLRMIGWGNDTVEKWPLGEVPAAPGVHELTADLPTGLAPSCREYVGYAIVAQLRRTAGVGSAAAVPVTVDIGEGDLYWPEDRGDVSIALDAEVVRPGGTISGRAPGSVEVGYVLTTPDLVSGKPQYPASVFWRPLAEGPAAFSVAVPSDALPTLHNGGETSVVWQVRCGDAVRVFAVLR